MKKTKRLLALVLAMMMAFTTLVLPAAAHGGEDEGIMPLYVALKCPRCNGAAELIEVPALGGGTTQKLVCLNGCGSW